MKRRAPLVATLLLATLLLACQGTQDRGRPALLLTTDDFAQQLNANPPLAVGIQDLYPDGVRPTYFVSRDPMDRLVANVVPAMSAGKPSAYVTTDLWFNYPKVWVQPMYVMVTGFAKGAAQRLQRPVTDPGPNEPATRDAPFVYTVGPKSGFYSPFWRVFYAIVPPGTPWDKYRSDRQILEDHLPLVPGPGYMASVLSSPSNGYVLDAHHPLLPLEKTSTPPVIDGWLDGAKVAVVDYGADRFTWNEHDEVDEAPLFIITVRDPARPDRFVDLGLPRIGGTGPVGAPRPPQVSPTNKPSFGSLWCLFGVRLRVTPQMRVFVPDDPVLLAEPAYAKRLETLMTLAPGLVPSAAERPSKEVLEANTTFAKRLDVQQVRAFQIALNGAACFKTPDPQQPSDAQATPPPCVWLDSQEALEKALMPSIERSDILVNCPFVNWNGEAVPTP